MRSRRRCDKASGRVPTSVFASSIESRAQRSESGRCLACWRPPVPIGVSMRWKRHGWPVRKKSPARRPQHGLHRRIRLERTAWRCAHLESARTTCRFSSTALPWKKPSAIAALSFRQFYFRFFAGAIRTGQIIEFLGALKRHMEKPLLIARDGAAIHRSRKLNAARVPCGCPVGCSGPVTGGLRSGRSADHARTGSTAQIPRHQRCVVVRSDYWHLARKLLPSRHDSTMRPS